MPIILIGIFFWSINFNSKIVMDTNQVGDVAEQAVVLRAMELGWRVCLPVGNSSSYDLIIDVDGRLVRIQVKSAWSDTKSGNYIVDNRRTKTNRREMIRGEYKKNDFDFAIVYLPDVKVFYVMPVEIFIEYGSSVTFVETQKRQRKPRSAQFREAWKLIA